MIESESQMRRVWAVVVTYRPDIEVLRALLDELVAQTDGVVVVDNTSLEDRRVDAAKRPGVIIERQGRNLGVAAALNIGIRRAAAAGADHVLLSDQDSLPAPGMIEGLVEALEVLQARGVPVAAVGPLYTDLHTGSTRGFKGVRPGRWFPADLLPAGATHEVRALTLITSGTLLPLSAFDAVGPMREDLFIDRVDSEWCLRARDAGWAVFGTDRARLYQRMGEGRLRVWAFGWRWVSTYAPVRIYYQVRNAIFLQRIGHAGPAWKLRSLWFALGIVYSHTLFGGQRGACLAMSLRGIRDGLTGRMGPYRG